MKHIDEALMSENVLIKALAKSPHQPDKTDNFFENINEIDALIKEGEQLLESISDLYSSEFLRQT